MTTKGFDLRQTETAKRSKLSLRSPFDTRRLGPTLRPTARLAPPFQAGSAFFLPIYRTT